ncbi:glycosyl hydrolase [Granulicella arctica]|uniref:Glycoside hydrolase n=1 Tax=Granulicella arctica TaxID=940613 RepID=A0A7Y9PI62_9BACT|nr:glycosyl hydrolase [Granulicella arctica]NYF80363.1 hypothetical protein [Granulicella arctica]
MKIRPRLGTRSCQWMLLLCLSITPVLSQSVPLSEVHRLFKAPPDDARIMMRWWWFGSAVTKPELKREILAMKAGGIGGFEIQPVYPLALDDPAQGFKNLPYLSPGFLDAVTFASNTARANHMRIDMTLASGWPYGGNHVPITQAAGRLRVVAVDVPPSATSIPPPDVGNGEALLATFLGEGSPDHYDPANLKHVELHIASQRAELPQGSAHRVALFFLSSRTGQQVKRPAADADGFVLDHFDKAAINTHLNVVGGKLMQAFANHPPYAVFSDSLEVYGSDWTPELLSEFQKRRGYDLTPYLPELFKGSDEKALAVRHDWGKTLTELIDENYLEPINTWATAHHTRFRSQTYGDPAVSLSSNALVALPEGEGPQWRRFSYTRWATSASHLYGRPITSAETWTWLHSPAFRATPLDMKAEGDLFFLEGVNQLIGHGWPYTPPSVAEPGWAFYAAAVFNDHNPWWTVMPDITKYLQRVSYLLRQGQSDNDAAVLLPNDDVYAAFRPGHVSLSDEMSHFITPALTEQILNNGYSLDYIDPEAIEHQGIHYPVLVLPHIDRLSPEVLTKITDYAAHGGKVIAIGATPSHAPGLMHNEEISQKVVTLSKQLFTGDNPRGHLIASDEDLGAALKTALSPDVELSANASEIGFIHRKLTDADLYFLVNTSNHDIHATAKFRSTWQSASSWNPMDGSEAAIAISPVTLDLAPYESRVIVFSKSSTPTPPPPHVAVSKLVVDLSHDWKLSIPQLHATHTLPTLLSWTEKDDTRFYSGEAIYTKDFDLTAAQLQGVTLAVDFGPGATIEPDPHQHGTRALLESPIREAAVVFVNGQRAGSIWHPPYTLDMTAQLHAGHNHLEIRVANLAINGLAGHTLPDYRLLNLRYGQRFVPQDMDNLQPLPSGILGPVKLIATERGK